MAMQRCRRGHYFDVAKSKVCPACGGEEGDPVPSPPKRQDEGRALSVPPTQAKGRANADREGNAPTVGVLHKQLGIDPVVGWLVCTDGAQRGRDYRLHSERNLIGRAPENDVCITGDETISRTAHAIISFEPRQRAFFLSAGESRGLVYLNREVIESAKKLEPYDVIELGQTRLVFVPFLFAWT
ncbi:MAG: FHA domain-containing protein [Deltaproteobacteria bacterium]|nr:FHA domain-containing protein [Deltaproteobacteria bacterium]